MATVQDNHPSIKMGDNAATDDDTPNGKTPVEPPASASASASEPFQSVPTRAPQSQSDPRSGPRGSLGAVTAAARRSSIRPAPASFKPTLRDTSKLPPPMVVHSGDVDENMPVWGDPDVANHPSQVKVDKPERPEPFAFAEDLHQPTLPLDFAERATTPSESQMLPAPIVESPLDSSAVVTQTKLERPAVHPASATAVQPFAEENPTASPLTVVIAGPPAAGAQPQGNSAASRPRRVVSVAAAVALLGLGVAMYAGGRGKAAVAVSPVPDNPAQAASPVAPPAEQVQPAVNPPAVTEPAASAPPEVPSVAAAQPAEPEGKLAASATSSTVTRVLVKMTPTDAKLTYRGVAVAGPPYYVEVPKGKKMHLEASRKGYVTRKVTVDWNKPEVNVGLVEPKKR